MVDNARKRLIDLAMLLAVLFAWVASASVIGRGTRFDPATGLWTIPGPAMETLMSVLGSAGPAVALVVFVAAIATRRWLVLVTTILLSGAGLMLTLSLGFFGSTHGYGQGRVTAADGHDYMLLSVGFQDYSYWLGRVKQESAWSTVVQAIAQSDDFAAPNVRLVRPAGAEKVTTGVRASADRRYVIVEVWEACATIALDSKTGKLWSSEHFNTGSTIEDLSPFVLLDDDDELHPADVEALRTASKCPRSKSLVELDPAKFSSHPNPAVRALFP